MQDTCIRYILQKLHIHVCDVLFLGQQSRRVHKTVDDVPSVGFDHDENKYKRKSFLDWFQRWLK